MTIADRQFANTLTQILGNGVSDKNQNVRAKWDDGTPATTKKIFGVVNRYTPNDGFPALELKRIPIKSCIDEVLWIWQKKSNVIKELKLPSIWSPWDVGDGTIGKAYGYQMAQKYQVTKDQKLDQTDAVLYLLNNDPMNRRILTNLFNFKDLPDMGLAPCVYSTQWDVDPENHMLNLMVHQRSADMIVANGWNVAQYAALHRMIAAATGYNVGTLTHVIGNCHIYEKHIPIAKEMIANYDAFYLRYIKNQDKFNQKVELEFPKDKPFYELTADDFKLVNYHPLDVDYGKIPVAV